MHNSILFSKVKIGNLELKNRIVFAPMGVGGLVGYNGNLSKRGIDYYVERAKGGAGMIRMGIAKSIRTLDVADEPVMKHIILDNRVMVNWMSELAERCHDYGAKISVQIMPGIGRIAGRTVQLQHKAIGPSENPCYWPPHYKTRALGEDEILDLIASFEQTAQIVRFSGFDAIELNGHEGYMLDQFMTPLWNKRSDQWGGNFENRMRLASEIIKSIQKGAGADFPIIFRFGLTHYHEGGRSIEEGLEIARYLEKAGVAAIEVDAGSYENWYYPHPPTTQPMALFADLAAETKKVLTIPVIAVGKLGDPDIAEKVLIDKKADIIALGRPLLADPYWPKKTLEGRKQDIKPCIGCHEGCLQRIFHHKYISCAVNPRTGNEKYLKPVKASVPKKILVLGSGYAGMEAAITAFAMGHKVFLYESENYLGGIFAKGYVSALKSEFQKLTEYYLRQIENSDIVVQTGKKVTTHDIDEIQPDSIFVATGAKATIPNIEGIDSANVFIARQAFHVDFDPGEKVLILGGGLVGCELAIDLAPKATQVTVLEQTDTVCPNAFYANRLHLLKLIEERNIEVHTNACLKKIEGNTATTEINGHSRQFSFDSLIVATGFEPNQHILDGIDFPKHKIFYIGDSVKPGKVLNAVWDAYRKVLFNTNND